MGREQLLTRAASKLLIGFTMYRCWVARLATSRTSGSSAMVRRARSRPIGLRVSSTAEASARYSRWRLTASCTRRPMIGATHGEDERDDEQDRLAPLRRPGRCPAPHGRPPPQNVKRRNKSARSAMLPTSTPTSSAKRMS